MYNFSENIQEQIYSLPTLKSENRKQYNRTIVSLVQKFGGEYIYLFTHALKSELFYCAEILATMEPQRLSENIIYKAACRDYSQNRGRAFYTPGAIECLVNTGIIQDTSKLAHYYHLNGSSPADCSEYFNLFYECEKKGIVIADNIYESFIKRGKYDIYDTLLLIGQFRQSPENIVKLIHNTFSHFAQYVSRERWHLMDLKNVKPDSVKYSLFTFAIDNHLFDLNKVREEFKEVYSGFYFGYLAATLITGNKLKIEQHDKEILIQSAFNYSIFKDIFPLIPKDSLSLNNRYDFQAFGNAVYYTMQDVHNNFGSEVYNNYQLECIFNFFFEDHKKYEDFYQTKISEHAKTMEELLAQPGNKDFFPLGRVNEQMFEFLNQNMIHFQNKKLKELTSVESASKNIPRI